MAATTNPNDSPLSDLPLRFTKLRWPNPYSFLTSNVDGSRRLLTPSDAVSLPTRDAFRAIVEREIDGFVGTFGYAFEEYLDRGAPEAISLLNKALTDDDAAMLAEPSAPPVRTNAVPASAVSVATRLLHYTAKVMVPLDCLLLFEKSETLKKEHDHRFDRITEEENTYCQCLRCWAYICLIEHGPLAREAIPELIAALRREELVWYEHVSIAYILARIGPEAKEAVPALADLLEWHEWGRLSHNCTFTSLWFAYALSVLDPSAVESVISKIVEYIDNLPMPQASDERDDGDWMHRWGAPAIIAALTLANLGRRASAATPKVIRAFSMCSEVVHAALSVALRQILTFREAHLDELAHDFFPHAFSLIPLDDTDWIVRVVYSPWYLDNLQRAVNYYGRRWAQFRCLEPEDFVRMIQDRFAEKLMKCPALCLTPEDYLMLPVCLRKCGIHDRIVDLSKSEEVESVVFRLNAKRTIQPSAPFIRASSLIDAPDDDAIDPLDRLIAAEEQAMWERTLRTLLTDQQRAIFLWHCEERRKYREIADALRITIRHAKYQFSTAVDILAAAYAR